VFRFVHVADRDDPALRDQFLSDRENGLTPFFRRERRYPELLDGMSAYESEQAAYLRWARCRDIAAARNEPMQVGEYIAEVELEPGMGFDIEDLREPDGHLTIWGDPDRLAQATCRIYTPTPMGE
jgi:hypothetical protein